MAPSRKKDAPSFGTSGAAGCALAEAPDLDGLTHGQFRLVAYRVKALGEGYGGLPRHALRQPGEEFDMEIPVGWQPLRPGETSDVALRAIEPPFWVEILGPAHSLERAAAPEL